MTRFEPPREPSPQEAHEENERAYNAESRYWAGLDRGDRHAPAPEPWCPVHRMFLYECQCGGQAA